MAKKYVNGKLVDMTLKDIEDLEQLAAQAPSNPPRSEAERIAELEAKLKALEILTGEVQ